MARRAKKSTKKSSSRKHTKLPKKPSTMSSPTKQNTSDSLDDETKLAKRHLTKEMWQLVSIAVKRMADELVSIPNTQTHKALSETDPSSLSKLSTTQQMGAGDEGSTPDKSSIAKESLPVQMIEVPLSTKQKATSNNAIRRSIKSARKSTLQHGRKNYKMK
ncbi:unnamed protein product [Adineta ricciae]|uniref:Uncharacterized protein n=1 Tax=Adineta ricciae TaxID=249248 RepID=A0A814JN78_ADIRI|nr:unnamed protein product [Adineta ricciae]CAF1039984.1 unnamed protein product [Adineta ricciae]